MTGSDRRPDEWPKGQGPEPFAWTVMIGVVAAVLAFVAYACGGGRPALVVGVGCLAGAVLVFVSALVIYGP